MPASELKFIKRCDEFVPRENRDKVPGRARGIYVLLRRRPGGDRYDVVYVGMAGGVQAGMQGRLRTHARKKLKWTHFSIYEVHDNISEHEVRELEGLFRHIYRKDTQANRMNVQRSYKKLKRVRVRLDKWS